MKDLFIELEDGVRLWTTQSGSNRECPVLLCGGGPGMADYLGPVANMIDDEAAVVRFEPRACGRSTLQYSCDLDTQIADLEAMREAYGFDSWTVAGHSAGAGLALAYALQHPGRVRRLIDISGSGIQNDRKWSEAYHRNKEERGEAVPSASFNREVNRLGNESWREFIHHPTLLLRISKLEVPALFLYGSEDIRPGWPSEQLSHLIPNASFVLIPGAPHYIWSVSPCDGLMRKELRTFLQLRAD